MQSSQCKNGDPPGLFVAASHKNSWHKEKKKGNQVIFRIKGIPLTTRKILLLPIISSAFKSKAKHRVSSIFTPNYACLLLLANYFQGLQ